jgi:hypothetical protein
MTETGKTKRRKQPRIRLLIHRLLLVVGSLFVALLIVEVGLRIAGFSYFNPYMPDADVGYSLRPGAAGWWTREGRTYVTINSQGFRDRERSIAKPAGTFRIAILGDSFAEAFQVPLEKTFWAVMERQLSACIPEGKQRVEVLNFGVSGFSTTRELILLETRVWEYSPDMVVLLFTPGNDVRDNSRTISRYGKQPLPYFVFRNGQLERDDSLVAERNRRLSFRLQQSLLGRGYYWLQAHSRVLGLIYTFREGTLSSQPANRDQNEPGLDSEIYRPPATPDWEEAWRVTEALMSRMREEVAARGAKFLLVTGSAGIQVNPDAATRQKFMERVGVSTLFYPDERLAAWGRANNADVLNLAAPLNDYANRNHVFVQGSSESAGRGHWNETGHQLAGEVITKGICRKSF